jgi:hypothetical protein
MKNLTPFGVKWHLMPRYLAAFMTFLHLKLAIYFEKKQF